MAASPPLTDGATSALTEMRERSLAIIHVADRLGAGSFAFSFAGVYAGIVKQEAALMRAEASRIIEVVDGIIPPALSTPNQDVAGASSAANKNAPEGSSVVSQDMADALALLTPNLRADRGWEYMLASLAEFKRTHGHTRVPAKEVNRDGKRLGAWVTQQRVFYRQLKAGSKTDSITEERIATLNLMGFEWEVQRDVALQEHVESAWGANYKLLLCFHEKNGHCRVPQSRIHKLYDPKLAQWVTKQRREYNNMQSGKKHFLTNERVSRLEALSFDFVVTPDMHSREKYDTDWKEMYSQLQDFKRLHGHLRVPCRDDTVKLARWISTQRMRYKKRQKGEKSTLSDDEIKELENIGIEWSVPLGRIAGKSNEPQWDAFYAELCKYKTEYGHCRIPFTAQSQHYKLHRWLSKQKAKVRKLEKLGVFASDDDETLPEGESGSRTVRHSLESASMPHSERWEVMFSELQVSNCKKFPIFDPPTQFQ
uniref:Helicase-associated domain-containing protein n=1 Tax=Odontella aurita TaxID=265563 RepID=A0A7S4J9Z7_9STRA|mmetsp:Transcript_41925/g.127133  ORF Transcript_41925/g.127133 Transcript_41925/m.127133 type:complete len:481 (+) Transcript_41925:64-1506(+)